MKIEEGQWYVDKTTGRIYVVAYAGGVFYLININTGIAYGSGVKNIKDVLNLDAVDFIQCKDSA